MTTLPSADRTSPRALWIWTGACLLALLAWDASGLDLVLAQLAGSRTGFAWRDHWLLAGVLHEGGRRAAWLVALALCLAVWWPIGPLRRLPQGDRLRLALATLLGAAAVSLLKAGSATSCPWDLGDFGGTARYASHWQLASDGGPGRCFPAGHASAGFSFVGGFLAYRNVDAAVARRWLLAALGAGLAFGLAQQWRGAHFMSHTLWAGWICWVTALALETVWPPVQARVLA